MFAKGQKLTAWKIAMIPAVMLGLSFAAVPFYDWFCRVTGFSGTTQVSEANSSQVLDEKILVRFSASTMADMPWEFHPVEPNMRVRIGETNLAFYEAYNPTSDVVTGTASYNVAPFEVGGYFDKIDCFCFTEQTLQPGERVQMPVSFFVDPSFVDDPDMKDVKSMTLAYTFHLTSRVALGTSGNNSETTVIN